MMRVLWSSLLVVLFVAGSSACTDGDTAAVDGKCREYQVCKNGTWAKDSCNTPLRKFDKKQKKCMWWFQVDCAEATQCTEGELRKNPYTCSSYYTCSNGKLESNHCFWPFFFDGERCKFWGDCKSSATEEKYAEECSGDEVEPIADSPRQYKTCKDGFFEQTSCWLGKKFDVDTKTCEWFWKVKSDVTACDGKARTTDKSGGKTYYQCNDKILLKKSCGLLQIFDAEQGRCVFSVKSINLNAVNDSVKMEDAAEAIKNVKGVYFTSMAGAEKKSDHPESTKTIDPALSYKTNVARVLRSIRNSYLMDSSCTDGSTQAALNCLSYKTCIGNTWVTRSCPDGQIFSNGQCTWQWKAQCNPGSCITGQKTAYIPDCKKYLLCDEKNNEVVKECTQHFWETQHFNPSSGKCEMVLPWASCPSSSYAVTCSEGGVFNPTTKVCEKARSKRSVEAAKNPNDCISGDTKC